MIVSHSESHEAVCAMIACGLGYSFLPRRMAETNFMRDQVSICDIDETLPRINAAIRMKVKKHYLPAQTAFLDFLREKTAEKPLF
jgi:DNA-binding transcriptional LysR family regulator